MQNDFCNICSILYLYRLYCGQSNLHLRRSTQTVFYYLIKCLNELLAPIMPHLAQEIHNELVLISKFEFQWIEIAFLTVPSQHSSSSLLGFKISLSKRVRFVFYQNYSKINYYIGY